jgi:hypothetical protein
MNVKKLNRKDYLKQVKEPAYLEYIRKNQPYFDSLTINNCQNYLVDNHLDFSQIPHTEFGKNPTRFGDEIKLKVFFNFRQSWNGISVSLYKREDGYFMTAGMHYSSLGYIGTYVISENHYRRLFNLAHGDEYHDKVNELFAETIDFVCFSQRLHEATLRIDSNLLVSDFFKEYLGLDDSYIKKIVSDIYFWVEY